MVFREECIARRKDVVLHHLHALSCRRERDLPLVLDRVIHAVVERELLRIGILADVVRQVRRKLRRKLVARAGLRLEVDEIARIHAMRRRSRAHVARERHVLRLLREEVAHAARERGIARRLVARRIVEDKRVLDVSRVLLERVDLLAGELILRCVLLRVLLLRVGHPARADEVLAAVVPLCERSDLIRRVVRHLRMRVLLRRLQALRRPVELKTLRLRRRPEIRQKERHIGVDVRDDLAEIVLRADSLVRYGLRRGFCYQCHDLPPFVFSGGSPR